MPFMGVPQGFEGARVTRQYRSTQFGQDRVVGAVGLAYMSHEPERMVSDGGAEAHHHGWSLRRVGTTPDEADIAWPNGIDFALDFVVSPRSAWVPYEKISIAPGTSLAVEFMHKDIGDHLMVGFWLEE